MFSTTTLYRTGSAIIRRKFGRLVAGSTLASSSSDEDPFYRDKVSANAAMAGAGLCFMIIYHYKDDIQNCLAKTAKDLIGPKVQLYAAAEKERKARRKATRKTPTIPAASGSPIAESIADTTAPANKKEAISWRERRFLDFASVEYRGQAFMSAADFLDSVREDTPSVERRGRRVLSEDESESMLKASGSPTKDYFRSLGNNGLISYTEYLFLLSILMKPHSSFRVAFKMFDINANQYIDKDEFLVMERIFSNTKYSKVLLQGRNFDKMAGSSDVSQAGEDGDEEYHERHPSLAQKVAAEHGRRDVQDTSLMRRFFGRRGRKHLAYEQFSRFMDDLQTEFIEIEFNEFSDAQPTIMESDFARMLLRHAFAHRDAYQAYLKQIEQKVRDSKGITFDQYRQFCLFLTNLDDFAMTVKLYTFRDLPVTQGEFARAAKVATGFALDPHLVDTLFDIFDTNGDGRLSYGEFISVMRDRLRRGARPVGKKSEWDLFKKCVRVEMRRY